MSKLIDHVIDYFWDKLIKPLLDAHADRYDLFFLALLTLLASVVYFNWQYFVAEEKCLHMGAFIIAAVIWSLIRNLQRQRPAHRMYATGIVIIICGLSAGWGYWAYTVYRVPIAPTDRASVYLSWFKNDPGQGKRNRFLGILGQLIAQAGFKSQLQLFDLRRSIHDEKEAFNRGQQVGATAVFWGQVDGEKVYPRFTLSGVPGMHRKPGGEFEEVQQSFEFESNEDKPSSDSADTRKGLLRFIVGYWYYRNKDFENAQATFSSALKVFEGHQSTDENEVTFFDSMLGTIKFYLGNAYFLNALQWLKDKDKRANAKYEFADAEQYYREALKNTKFATVRSLQYVEALNNLGLILTRQKADEAIEFLSRARGQCEEEGQKTVAPVACTHVLYNLASSQLEAEKYEGALETLGPVLKDAANLDEREDRYRLIGNSYQLMAYAMIKEADRGDPEQVNARYEKAEAQIRKGYRDLR